MKVILDNQSQPQGIFIPFDEWEKIKAQTPPDSQLYQMMDAYKAKSVFEMSEKELASHLGPFTQSLVGKALAAGHYSLTLNSSPPGKFLHEYASGRKEAVDINSATGAQLIYPLTR
ncbi:MAG: hypothetical protein M3O71_21380 [Bacteroidota bacterium]|nr:hypothetical protein [Bacteroidota bacterium]